MIIICKHCNKKFISYIALNNHLRSINIKPKYYYNKYIKKENEGYCLCCKKETKYISLSKGYRNFCSSNCANKDVNKIKKIKNTKNNKSNEEKKIIVNKMKKTKLELYGNENYTNKEKIKKTMLERYNGFSFESDILKKKVKNTNIKKYGKEYFTNRRKAIQTMINKYGVEFTLQSNELKNKMKKTKLKKYGNESYTNRNKSRQTMINKYGIEIPLKCKKFKEKAKQTCLKKYGFDNPLKSKIIRQKIKNTILKKYGVDCILKLDEIIKKSHSNESNLKKYNTHKLNNSFNTSKPEDNLYKILLDNFNNVKRNYKTELYPFACDFYIPKLNLYIELNKHWTHGNEPFNRNNKEHNYIFRKWIGKSKNSDFYRTAIEVWTKIDIKKRQDAKNNNLNYLEIFDYKNEQDVLNQIKRIA